jgi:ElaB/YqjD/DUF883 family membrane-anchored ribosome-binding protein
MANEDAVDRLDHLADRAVETADDIADAGSDVAQRATKAVDDFSAALERSVHDQPLLTLGAVLACGVFVGALWKL